jgi:hypothetical protein
MKLRASLSMTVMGTNTEMNMTTVILATRTTEMIHTEVIRVKVMEMTKITKAQGAMNKMIRMKLQVL